MNQQWSFNEAFQAHETHYLDCCLQVGIVVETVDNIPAERDWMIVVHNHRQQTSFLYRGILWDARSVAIKAALEMQSPSHSMEC